MKTLISHSEAQTRAMAAKFAKKLTLPSIICLYGNLGCGKTVFTKGLAEGLGISATRIKSPTYTFVREHKHNKLHFYHFDFYRIEDGDELMTQELQEIFAKKNAFIVIEWPQHVQKILPPGCHVISLTYKSETDRIITFPND